MTQGKLIARVKWKPGISIADCLDAIGNLYNNAEKQGFNIEIDRQAEAFVAGRFIDLEGRAIDPRKIGLIIRERSPASYSWPSGGYGWWYGPDEAHP